MKYLIAILLLTGITTSGCKKDASITGLDRSMTVWNDFKSSSHNTYQYTAYFGSWTGAYVETKITVVNGRVTGRDYTAGHYAPNNTNLVTDKAWSETSADLNTHTEGHESVTIDQLYQKAKTELLTVSKKDNDIYFEANNNGILSSAGYVPKNCQDDCFIGIQIKDVKIYVKEIR